MALIRERLIFIDVLRGYAILMMLQGHTIGVVLQEHLRDPKYPAFMIWRYLTGLTAPVFFLAAGLIFAYLMAKAEEQGGARLLKGVRRGLWLMVLGWILMLWPPILEDFGKGEIWKGLRFFGKSHVLHTIGLSIMALVGLWLLCGRRGRVFVGVSFVLSQFALLVGPMTETWDLSGMLGRALGTFFSRQYAAFPFLPWVGYVLMGGALGVLAWQTKWYQNRLWFGVLAAGGLFLVLISYWMVAFFWSLFGGVSEEQIYEFSGRYWRVGESLFFVSLVGLACRFLQRKGYENSWPIRVIIGCGQETLAIYFLHIFVVYGVVFGVGIAPFFARDFGVWASIGTALLVEVAFISLALRLPRLRKRYRWLKWLR